MHCNNKWANVYQTQIHFQIHYNPPFIASLGMVFNLFTQFRCCWIVVATAYQIMLQINETKKKTANLVRSIDEPFAWLRIDYYYSINLKMGVICLFGLFNVQSVIRSSDRFFFVGFFPFNSCLLERFVPFHRPLLCPFHVGMSEMMNKKAIFYKLCWVGKPAGWLVGVMMKKMWAVKSIRVDSIH